MWAAIKGEKTPIEVADEYYHTHFGDIWGWIKGDYPGLIRNIWHAFDNSPADSSSHQCGASAQLKDPAKPWRGEKVLPMPAGLTAGQQQLRRTCEELHDKYKDTQHDAELIQAQLKPLKDRLYNNSASQQDRVEFCGLIGQKIALIQQLLDQREEDIGRGCDQFEWNKGKTYEGRIESHTEERNNTEQQLKNLKELAEKFCK